MEDLSVDLIEEANKLFNTYDVDRSNFIEKKELYKLMIDIAKEAKIPEPTQLDIEALMNEYDVNKDDKISKEEFLHLFKMLYVLKSMNK